MEQHILDKKQMDTMKMLADTNLKISEARGKIFQLEKDEESYLQSREKKALERIQKLFDDSSDLLKSAQGNYDSIQALCKQVMEFCDFLIDAQQKFQSLVDIFMERNKLWEEKMRKMSLEFEETKKLIDSDKRNIEERSQRLDDREKEVNSKIIWIRDREDTLTRSIAALKSQ